MNICVFAASAEHLASQYVEDAEALGRLLARGGHTLVYGAGASGLMAACARGVRAEGGESIGVAPRFFDEPGALEHSCTRLIFTETMSERKRTMEELADAFIALPGGIGTFEEWFEVLTLKQLGRHGKPMVLLNTLSYYDELLQLLSAAAEKGFLGKSCLTSFFVARTSAEALAFAEKETMPPAYGGKQHYHD